MSTITVIGSMISLIVLAFVLGPPILLLLVVRFYPCGHGRRAELVRELEEVPYSERPRWVVDLLPVIVLEGVELRDDYSEKYRILRLIASALRAIQHDEGAAVKRPPLLTLSRTYGPDHVGNEIEEFTGSNSVVRQVGAELVRDLFSSVPIVAISGESGVGKTSLAVHICKQVADQFPDGQLHLKLRGRYGPAVRPQEAFEKLLSTIGISSKHLPRRAQQRSDLFRSSLAGRRVLLLLDDAVEASQVLSLIPQQAGCAVLITSREALDLPVSAHQFNLQAFDFAPVGLVFESAPNQPESSQRMRYGGLARALR